MKTYLYAAWSDALVKIGCSEYPLTRIRTIVKYPTKSPSCTKGRPFQRVLIVEGTRQEEKDLHAALRAFQVKGEWFSFDCEKHSAYLNIFANREHVRPQTPRLSIKVTLATDAALAAAAGIAKTSKTQHAAAILRKALRVK